MDYKSATYKEEKVKWVTGHTGGTMWEINMVTGVMLCSYVLWSALIKYTQISTRVYSSTLQTLLFEFLVLVFPSLLACTLLSSYAFYINVALISAAVWIVRACPPAENQETKKKSKWQKDSDNDELDELLVVEGEKAAKSNNNKDHLVHGTRKPFLSVYRAGIMILTCIAILAVDFTVFPRRFAKVETFGTSLMDLGVGSFVFSAGIVAAKPFLKRPENRFKPLGGQLVNACKHAFPLFVLGFARLIAVKGVDYQEHVSEYGVHWNFFFTLAFLPIFITLCRAVERYARFAVVGLVIIGVYQLALSKLGLEEYIQNAPRTDLISANKEGIFSFFGYLAIFIFAFDTGHYILPADPYYAFRQNRKPSLRPKQRKLAMILFSCAILWCVGFMVVLVCGIQVSRQMANISYVFWVAVYNTGFLWLFQSVELMFFDRYWVKEGIYVPHIIEAFNTNGLAVFILANLLTGLINLTIRTLYASTIVAESIIYDIDLNSKELECVGGKLSTFDQEESEYYV